MTETNLLKIILTILARGNDVSIRKTKTGYKIFEVSRKIVKEIVDENIRKI